MAGHDGYTRYTIRVPEGLYGRVQSAAEESGRSVNAEIVHVLEEAFPDPLPDYRQLLKMVFDFLEESGAPEELNLLSRDIISKLNDLPEDEGEKLAREMANPILDSVEEKVKEFRASKNSPDTPNLDRLTGRRKIDLDD